MKPFLQIFKSPPLDGAPINRALYGPAPCVSHIRMYRCRLYIMSSVWLCDSNSYSSLCGAGSALSCILYIPSCILLYKEVINFISDALNGSLNVILSSSSNCQQLCVVNVLVYLQVQTVSSSVLSTFSCIFKFKLSAALCCQLTTVSSSSNCQQLCVVNFLVYLQVQTVSSSVLSTFLCIFKFKLSAALCCQRSCVSSSSNCQQLCVVNFLVYLQVQTVSSSVLSTFLCIFKFKLSAALCCQLSCVSSSSNCQQLCVVNFLVYLQVQTVSRSVFSTF